LAFKTIHVYGIQKSGDRILAFSFLLIIKTTQVTTHPFGPPLYPDVSSKQLIEQRGGRKAKIFELPLPAGLLLEFSSK
jgi:hypothetical protein